MSSKSVVAAPAANKFPALIARHEAAILDDWIARQLSATTRRADLIDERNLREQSREFLRAFQEAVQSREMDNVDAAAWQPVREHLSSLAAERARAGFSASETATFVLSLKEPLFARVAEEFSRDPGQIGRELWAITKVLDALSMITTEAYATTREEVIKRQQRDLLELSTPVVALWKDILALPLIGMLDSQRTQVVMESLLGRIVETGARIAILDITGVPTVDTLVAQHLLKTVAAARLMGADCIISGIRPQIAQTIVHLGVDLSMVTTKATLREAFAVALQRTGQHVQAGNGSQTQPAKDPLAAANGKAS
jgi:rsbT co-antagonist protein RsbR